MSKRTDQVGALIQQDVGELMMELELPAMTTISRVEVSADLKHAKIWLTVFSEKPEIEQQVLKTLKDNIYDLQGGLNERMSAIHHTPRISFALDSSLHYASRINELIRQAKKEDGGEPTDTNNESQK